MNQTDFIFFKGAVKQICGHLEIGTALEDCLEFLKKFMPACGMAMNIYDPKKQVVNNIAMVSELSQDGSKDLGTIPLTPDAANYIETLPPVPDSAIILNTPDEHIVAELVWKAMGRPKISFLILHPVVASVKLGVVFIFAKGFNRYQEEDARRFTLLHDVFAIALSNTIRHRQVVRLKQMLADDNRYLADELRQIRGSQIIGADHGLKQVMTQACQVAPLSSHVLILGETGAGKEVIANAIHKTSPRSDRPMIRVNCGAIPQGLIDTELFGHEKGAFTGAAQRHRGWFERADKGTVFLDEIGELPLKAQVRLLRVIQNREIQRVGGSEPIAVDIRIIAATHRNLEEMVQEGTFREDLWFRLNVFPIPIPPLRDRLLDIPGLVSFFILKKSREMNIAAPPVPSVDYLEPLLSYHWPGNVRELENVVERALILNYTAPPHTPLNLNPFKPRDFSKHKIDLPPKRFDLDEVVRQHIQAVLNHTQGRVKGKGGAAELLKINPSTLRSRMKKIGITSNKRACKTHAKKI